MKPPSSGRFGGPNRPSGERGPQRGGGGSQHGKPGAPGHAPRGHAASGARPPRPPEPRMPDQRAPEQRDTRPRAPGAETLRARPRDEAPNQGPRPPQGPREERRRDGPRPGNHGKHHGGHHAGGHHGGGHHGGGRPHHAPRPDPDAPRGAVWLYGHHAVAAALANPARRIRRLLLTEEAEAGLATRLPPPWSAQPERTDRGRLDQLLGRDVVHQGIALLADPLPQPLLAQVLERPGPVVVLDQVSDPRNVGAILRSAAAFGAAAVVTQDRNAPEETGALAKAASGAMEAVPLLRAVNIARTLIALKAAGCWCVGMDAGGTAPLSGPALAERRVALVLGAEGDGLRRLTRDTCDEIAGLTMPGAMESLNVSAAAAVALYELTRRA